MDDRELRASLRRLPEARPGEAFTAEVLARVERDERRRAAAGGVAHGRGEAGPRWRPTLLAAGLAVALVAAAGLWSAGGGGWWGGIGDDGDESALAVPRERPGDGAGGPATRGEGGASVAVGAARLDEEDGGGPAVGGGAASVVAGGGEADGEGAAAGVGHAGRPAAGDRAEAVAAVAAGTARPDGAAQAGAPGRSTHRTGRDWPPALASPPRPLAERISAEAAAADASRPDPGSGAAATARAEAPPAAEPAAPAFGADFFAVPPGAAPPAAERLARLREERERLERRLAELRSELPPAEPPVVLLGGEEGFDLVFDLGRWAAPPPAGVMPAAARPAVHSTGQPPRRF